MLWSQNQYYESEPFELEEHLESAIIESSLILFGESRFYLDMKKLIGKKGSTRNIPDGYLIDLTSTKEPKIYLVEVELSKHDPLKHIAVQILEFSLSFETSPQLVKSIIKDELTNNPEVMNQCNEYAIRNGFENVDYLLEKMIYKKDSFNALVIIDEIDEELETVLLSRFKFPVEVLKIQRFISKDGKRLYNFEPFLADVGGIIDGSDNTRTVRYKTIDPSEIDTIIVPAQDDGFNDVFIKQNCWWAIRIHSSMIPKIKHIAAYRVAPISAITHIAKVKKIEQWQDTSKYIVQFEGQADKIGPIKLVPKSSVKALQSARYSSFNKLQSAKSLDEAF